MSEQRPTCKVCDQPADYLFKVEIIEIVRPFRPDYKSEKLTAYLCTEHAKDEVSVGLLFAGSKPA